MVAHHSKSARMPRRVRPCRQTRVVSASCAVSAGSAQDCAAVHCLARSLTLYIWPRLVLARWAPQQRCVLRVASPPKARWPQPHPDPTAQPLSALQGRSPRQRRRQVGTGRWEWRSCWNSHARAGHSVSACESAPRAAPGEWRPYASRSYAGGHFCGSATRDKSARSIHTRRSGV